MLTQNELEWYDLRPYDGTAWCYHCPQWGQNCSTSPFCPLINADMEDALEFSERVATKLAEEHEKIMLNAGFCDACFAWDICSDGFNKNDNAHCAFEMLKAACLAVEEEMDAEEERRS